MSAVTIIMLVLSVICLAIGLMLSGSGTTNGLSAISGQDLEIFRKTKDRGLIKILQMVMFVLMVALIIIAILAQIYGW